MSQGIPGGACIPLTTRTPAQNEKGQMNPGGGWGQKIAVSALFCRNYYKNRTYIGNYENVGGVRNLSITHTLLFTPLRLGCLGFYLRIQTKMGQGACWRSLAGSSPKGRTAHSGGLADFGGVTVPPGRTRSWEGGSRWHPQAAPALLQHSPQNVSAEGQANAPRATPVPSEPQAGNKARLTENHLPSASRYLVIPRQQTEGIGRPTHPHKERTHEFVRLGGPRKNVSTFGRQRLGKNNTC